MLINEPAACNGPGTTFCQLAGFNESVYCSQYHLPGLAVNITFTPPDSTSSCAQIWFGGMVTLPVAGE